MPQIAQSVGLEWGDLTGPYRTQIQKLDLINIYFSIYFLMRRK